MSTSTAKPIDAEARQHQFEAASLAGRGFRPSALVHDHADVLGVKVSAINMNFSVNLAAQWIERGQPGYVCVASVHGVMEAQRDPELLRIFNQAVINTPDGMPLTWIGRLQGFAHMDRVFGPDFMMEVCRISVERGYRHFLYGGKPGVAEELSKRLQSRFPRDAGVFRHRRGALHLRMGARVPARIPPAQLAARELPR